MSTGPKTSFWTTSESFEAGRMRVGSYHSPSGPPSSDRRPPNTISSPAALARSTKPSTRARWSGWISGESVVSGSPGVAGHVRVDVGAEALHELAGDLRVHEQPGPRQADLPRVVVHLRGAGSGVVEIGVGEHQQRPLAAELTGERDEVGRCGATDRPRRSRASR